MSGRRWKSTRETCARAGRDFHLELEGTGTGSCEWRETVSVRRIRSRYWLTVSPALVRIWAARRWLLPAPGFAVAGAAFMSWRPTALLEAQRAGRACSTTIARWRGV